MASGSEITGIIIIIALQIIKVMFLLGGRGTLKAPVDGEIDAITFIIRTLHHGQVYCSLFFYPTCLLSRWADSKLEEGRH